MDKRFFSVIFLVLVFFGGVQASAIAMCATQAYSRYCMGCPFDEAGRVDKACREGHENKGKICTSTAYPVATGKYALGMCPALEECVSALRACINVKCPGSDRDDCQSEVCRSCLEEADRCAYMASKDCDAKEECGNGRCVEGGGESQESCCSDCGCPTGFECKDNSCKEKPPEAETTTTTKGWPMSYPNTQSSGNTIWDLLEKICPGSMAAALMAVLPLMLLSKMPERKRD